VSIQSRWRRPRRAVSSIALAALLVGSFGLTAVFASAEVASATTTGDFTLPVGAIATISGATFSACDPLVYGYELNLNPSDQVALANMDGCGDAGPVAGATIGPFTTSTIVTIFLTDSQLGEGVSSPVTFLSDGAGDHSLVSGSGPYTVDIMDDAVGACGYDCVRPPAGPGTGNITLTLTITPPPPLTGTAVTVGPATTNVQLTTPVATFVDADTAAPLTNYSALISWGDGTTSSASSITGSDGSTYTVYGQHTYTAHGTTASRVTVAITSTDGGSNLVTDNFVTVADAVIACTTSPCSGTLSSPAINAQASTSSTGSGDLFLSSDPNSGGTVLNCGDNFRHAPRIIDESNTFAAGAGSITTTDTFLNKNGIPGKGLEGLLYAVCFQSTNSFVNASGKSTTLGLLPLCNPFKPGPGPCVNWILPGAGGTIVERLTYPVGDPRFG
jgi:hypothetical protein